MVTGGSNISIGFNTNFNSCFDPDVLDFLLDNFPIEDTLLIFLFTLLGNAGMDILWGILVFDPVLLAVVPVNVWIPGEFVFNVTGFCSFKNSVIFDWVPLKDPSFGVEILIFFCFLLFSSFDCLNSIQ